jgi:hypothetical protein
MKSIKKLVTAAIVAAMLCALPACSNNEPEGELCSWNVFVVRDTENIGFEEAILDEISVAASRNYEISRFSGGVGAMDLAREYRTRTRMAEIEEFYFPTIEIDGFELDRVMVWGGALEFRYRLSELSPEWLYYDADGKYIQGSSPEISIVINRLCSFVTDPVETFSEMIVNHSHSSVLIEGDMLYNEWAHSLQVLADNVLLYIAVPKNMSDLDFLRTLAREVIESLELVTVR